MTSADSAFESPGAGVAGDVSLGSGRYGLPSQLNQMFSVFGVQMRLYSKSRSVYIFVVLALLIPVFAYALRSFVNDNGLSVCAAHLLDLLPLMIAIIPPVLAGKILSSEFRSRTGYLTFPLPMSRTSFYFGKFLAAMTVTVSVFGLAYGLSIVVGSSLYYSSFPNDVIGSFLVCIAAVFAISAMAYGLSTLFKKGATGLTVAITILLPIILILVVSSFFRDITVSDLEYLALLPQFGGDHALNLIDSGHMPMISIFSMAGIATASLPLYMYIGASVAWGALFLAIGLFNTINKEL